MANKITKRDNFNALLNIEAVAKDANLVAFINHELELLDRKNKSKSGELTETQKENLVLADKVFDFISASGKALSTADVRQHFGLTAQKVTPILGNLVDAGKLTRSIEKRVAFYSVA